MDNTVNSICNVISQAPTGRLLRVHVELALFAARATQMSRAATPRQRLLVVNNEGYKVPPLAALLVEARRRASQQRQVTLLGDLGGELDVPLNCLEVEVRPSEVRLSVAIGAAELIVEPSHRAFVKAGCLHHQIRSRLELDAHVRIPPVRDYYK